MSRKNVTSRDVLPSDLAISTKERYQQNLKHAKQLLADYQLHDSKAVTRFKENHPQGNDLNFVPTLQDARLIISGKSVRLKRFSFEKLKKEAKDLLRALKTNESEAVVRLEYHPKGLRDVNVLKLADAQCIIAGENGFVSWAKLKTHFSEICLAQEHIHSPRLKLDHDLKTLHVRCGTDIQSALKTCGFSGEFLEISNPFPEGRVPPFDPIDNFVNVRGDFIVQNYGADVPPEFSDRIKHAYDEIRDVENKLRSLPQNCERIVLWFEHDPFDQLCLAYVLAHLVNINLGNCLLELIQIDRFPGIKKFIGIGYLCEHPENLILLWQQRERISSTMTAFGTRFWSAFTTDNPTELWQLSQEQCFPIMRQAMLRMLKELPWTTNGLSLTEQLALEIIDRDGPINMAKTFHFLNTESEPMSFLGDIMFLSVMRLLWQDSMVLKVIGSDANESPMLRETVEITATGRELIRGQHNWLKIGDPRYKRWVGNVRVSNSGKQWYWCPEKDRPVLIK